MQIVVFLSIVPYVRLEIDTKSMRNCSSHGALLHLDQHFQYAGLRSMLKCSQSLIQAKLRTDERAYVYKLLAQGTQGRGKWAAARSLQANLVDHDRGEM